MGGGEQERVRFLMKREQLWSALPAARQRFVCIIMPKAGKKCAKMGVVLIGRILGNAFPRDQLG